MSAFEQSVSLLRQNKRDLVSALNDLGFLEVTETTRASLFPMYVKWAKGLLDITVAARAKAGATPGAHVYFTLEEYQAMDSAARSNYIIRGVRLRANAKCLIIALVQQSLKWGYPSAVVGASNHTSPGMFKFENSRSETEVIKAHCQGEANGDVTALPPQSSVWTIEPLTPRVGSRTIRSGRFRRCRTCFSLTSSATNSTKPLTLSVPTRYRPTATGLAASKPQPTPFR